MKTGEEKPDDMLWVIVECLRFLDWQTLIIQKHFIFVLITANRIHVNPNDKFQWVGIARLDQPDQSFAFAKVGGYMPRHCGRDWPEVYWPGDNKGALYKANREII